MKRILWKIWPIVFILILWFIFSAPYFIKGNVPFPSSYQVNHFHPWSLYEKYWGPVKNGAMPDIIDQIYPWRHLTFEIWKDRQIPFWNPYNFSGNPHLANYQSAVLSPFNLIFFVVPFVDGWSILVLIQPLFAGLFTYLLLRELKVSKTGSATSSIAFMFCGFIVTWMAYTTLSMAILFLPLALFAIEKYFNIKKVRYLLLLSISIPLSFFSGHFQTSIYFFLFVLAFFVFKTITIKKRKISLYIFISIIVGFVLSLPQILPSIQFYENSVRSNIFIQSGGIPFYYLVNSLSPDFFGNPVTRNDWFGYYAEWASFIGIIPLTLACFSLVKRNKNILFFFFAGIASLILALDSPLIQLISFLKLPVLSTSMPSRIIVLFSFSFSVLAGFGFDNLKKLIAERQTKKVLLILLSIALLLSIIWMLLLIVKILPDEKLIIAKRNLILPSLLFFSASILTLLANKYRKFFGIISLLLILLVSFDSFRFAQKWIPYDSKDLVFPNIPIISKIKEYAGFGRVYGNLGAQIASYYHIQTIEGYDPLYIGRYGEFIRSSDTGNFLEGERSVVKLPPRNLYGNRLLDLLSVSLIYHPIGDTNQSWAYPVWEDKKRFSLAYQDDKIQLYKNNEAMDRIKLFYNYEVIKNEKDIIKRFYSSDFDFRNKLILEEKVPGFISSKGNGKAKIISYEPNKISVRVTSDKPALLFLSDNFYPGWKAAVNSKEVKIYRADYTFRAVLVPKGESEVEFYYFLI